MKKNLILIFCVLIGLFSCSLNSKRMEARYYRFNNSMTAKVIEKCESEGIKYKIIEKDNFSVLLEVIIPAEYESVLDWYYS